LTVGDPMNPRSKVGPLARPDLRSALHAQVQASIDAGAVRRLGGEITLSSELSPDCFYPPTVLTRVTADMAVAREETFGPVAAVLRVADEAAAVAMANNTEYGLAASVWTGDRERGKRIAAQLHTGAVFINKMAGSDPRVPFGGVGKSGYGRELGAFGLREFVNVKTVWVE